jgi:hydrogenase/urease accessory protein HupE
LANAVVSPTVDLKDMVADGLTKPLVGINHEKFVKIIGLKWGHVQDGVLRLCLSCFFFAISVCADRWTTVTVSWPSWESFI